MSRKVIIIQGYLAAGKSTFLLQLSKALQIPYLCKDTFKSALCSGVDIDNREKSSLFSVVTFDGMMYVLERMLEVGMPIIIEGNFMPHGIKKTDEEGIIKNLINQYGYTSLTYSFIGDTSVLYQRFIRRENSAERERANKMFSEVSFEDFEGFCHNMDGFDVGGEIISVDTTDFHKVDYEEYIRMAHSFLELKE